jgi:hypothetical protein
LLFICSDLNWIDPLIKKQQQICFLSRGKYTCNLFQLLSLGFAGSSRRSRPPFAIYAGPLSPAPTAARSRRLGRQMQNFAGAGGQPLYGGPPVEAHAAPPRSHPRWLAREGSAATGRPSTRLRDAALRWRREFANSGPWRRANSSGPSAHASSHVALPHQMQRTRNAASENRAHDLRIMRPTRHQLRYSRL